MTIQTTPAATRGTLRLSVPWGETASARVAKLAVIIAVKKAHPKLKGFARGLNDEPGSNNSTKKIATALATNIAAEPSQERTEFPTW
jgi:hypothetical protein